MLLSEEDLARILQNKIDEEEAATGERSPLRDQPVHSLPPITVGDPLDDVPGFTRQGAEDAPYFVPTEETYKAFKPMADDQQAPSSIDDAPPALAPQQSDPEAELRALIPDAFEAAAERQRRGVRPSEGRQEGLATDIITKGVPTVYRALDDLAKKAFEQSGVAAEGDPTYNPKPVLDAAQMVLPAKGALLVGGGLMAGELGAQKGRPLGATPQELADLLVPSAEAMTPEEQLRAAALKRLAPDAPVGQGTPGAPVDAAEQLRQLGQGRIEGGVPTEAKMPRKPTMPIRRSKDTDQTWAKKQADHALKLADFEAKSKEFYKTYTPTAKRVLERVGGQKVVNPATYGEMATTAGQIALISGGMILAPRVFRAFRSTVAAPPRSFKDALLLRPGVFGEQRNLTGRAVTDALPGTRAFSTPTDILRSADDINRVALNISRRVGIIQAVQERLENTFSIYTRAQARHLTESAIETGRMETPGFRFRAPVSLAQMERTFTPEMRQYVIALDTLESLAERSRLPQFTVSPRNPTPGLPTIGGQTFPQVAAIVHAMEQANPALRPAGQAWADWNAAVRRFNSAGEYATIPIRNTNPNPATPNRSVAYMNAQHRYEVPWLGREQNRSFDIAERLRRQDPIQMQKRYSQIALKERMENEAKGQYIDAMRRAQPGSFVRVGRTEAKAAEILAENPHMRSQTVTMYRRGVKETYTTDPLLADVLKMQPDMIPSGAQIVYGTKRILEWGSTGLGAPWFAPVSMMRNYFIGKMSADAGYRTPSLMGTLASIPQQLTPQVARAISMSMEAGSGGMLSRFAGQGWADSLNQVLANHYLNSFYAQLQRSGTARGSILEHEHIATGLQAFQAQIAGYTGPARPWLNSFGNMYKSIVESMHNAAAFDYARKNSGAYGLPNFANRFSSVYHPPVDSLPTVASNARALTGDPRRAGQYYFKDQYGNSQPIRYERGGSVSHTLGEIAARPLAWMAENVGRTAIPWFNPTQQGIKRIGEAYLENPAAFVTRAYMYAGAPAAAAYFYAHSLGNDPNGKSYVEYMLRGRGSYPSQMNFYIPIPGKPAEDGVEVPFFHELAPVKRLTEIGIDHMFGTPQNELRNDFWKAAHSFLDTAIIPPLPPVVAAPMAAMGINPPMGMFGGEPYAIKTDPFDQLGGMGANIESFTRALSGGVATTVGAGAAAFTQTPEGFHKALWNAGKESVKSIASRTPFVRDITGILPPMTGNTDTRKELFEQQKEIDQLLKFYTANTKNEGQISTKAASKGGAMTSQDALGNMISEQPPGLIQPPPTNPLYVKMMEDVYNRFKHESPNYVKGEDQGGIGFKSLWRRYGDSTAALKTLRPINEGNYATWQTALNSPQRAEVKKELQDAKVDTSNLREVKNYYTNKQQDAARVILQTIRAVMEDFNANPELRALNGGRVITLKDIRPYNKPLPDAPFSYPDVVEDVSRSWNTGAQ